MSAIETQETTAPPTALKTPQQASRLRLPSVVKPSLKLPLHLLKNDDSDAMQIEDKENTAPKARTGSLTNRAGSASSKLKSARGTAAPTNGSQTARQFKVHHWGGPPQPRTGLKRAGAATGAQTARTSLTQTKRPRAPLQDEGKKALRSSTASGTASRVATKARPATTARTTTTTRKVSPRVSTQVAGMASRRPKWDIKGQLQDAKKREADLRNAMVKKSTDLASISTRLSASDTRVKNLNSMRMELEQQIKQETDARVQLEREMGACRENIAKLSSQVDAKEGELSSALAQKARLESDLNANITKVHGLEGTLGSVRTRLEESEATRQAQFEEIQRLTAEVARCVQRIEELEEKARADELTRRRLHNTIQELKGNIRVFCRVRPHLGETEASPVSFPPNCDHQQIELLNEEKGRARKYSFTFDKVFGPEAQQGHVFSEIAQLVQSALDGYHVCIFAYGQTGSGKTYTMQGGNLHDPMGDERGMIPRAVEQIFAVVDRLGDQGWRYTFEASFLEIYNESIRDLLAPPSEGDSIAFNTRVGASQPAAQRKHDIKHDSHGTTVTDLTVVPVATVDVVHDLLARSNTVRATAATACNERSSRSHSVFTLRITGANDALGQVSHGVLNLVDLAGSERLAVSGATGDRLKETQAINKSLSALGDVIAAIASNSSHIPYRNSKLTYLLQKSLGGDSKALMFVNVAPGQTCLNETLCSLRFAAKVNSCQMNKAPKRKMEFKFE